VFQHFQTAGDWVALIVLFGLCIFVHELGHFLAARAFGMVVDTFSLGFGPAIWKKKVGRTTYKIAWIPLGGYVALPQLDPSGMEALQGQTEQDADRLPPVPPWKRIVVCLAGPAGNIVLAVILAWIVFLAPARPEKDTELGTRVGSVETNSSAYAAGLRVGDRIIAVNGEKVASWSEFQVETYFRNASNQVSLTVTSADGERTLVIPTTKTDMGVHVVAGVTRGSGYMVREVLEGSPARAGGMQPGDMVKSVDGRPVGNRSQFSAAVSEFRDRQVTVGVERAGKPVELQITPRYNAEHDLVMVGVKGDEFERGVPMWMEHREPVAQIRADASSIFRILKALFTRGERGKAWNGLGGPILIVATLWVAIQESFINAIAFLRFLNVNLAVLNLLPLPVLDGGHIVFFLWEAITRRRVHPKVVHYVTNAMAALLIGVFVIICSRDVVRMNKLNWLRGRPAPAAVSNAVPAAVTGDAPVSAVSTGATAGAP
jgi:regulator of sigma E protease